MTTWTDIPDEVLEPGKPIRSIDILALRDNILAVPGGATGAPKVVTNALATNERMTTANVLAAYAGASAGAVGTYIRAIHSVTGTNTLNTTLSVASGTTIAGSALRGSGYTVSGDTSIDSGYVKILTTSSVYNGGGNALSGTWRVMGTQAWFRNANRGSGQFDAYWKAILCLRIS